MVDLDTQFQAPTEQQVIRMKVIQGAAKALAMAIINNAPAGEGQVDALKKVREAMMAANILIVLEK